MRWLYGMAGIGFVLGSVASYTQARSWLEPPPTRYVLFVAAYAMIAAPIIVAGRGYPFLLMDLIRVIRGRSGDRPTQVTACAKCGYDLRGATSERREQRCHGSRGNTMNGPLATAHR